MKRGIITALTLALMSGTAFAGDLNRRGSTKDLPEPQTTTVSEGVVNWTGFYIGGAVGYGNSNHNLSVNEYFKDYCSWDTDDETNTGWNERHSEARARTLENYLKNVPALTGTSCETLARPAQGTETAPVLLGKATVPGDSREVATIDGVNAKGVVGDVRLGYDQAIGRFVVGVWGSYNFSGQEADITVGGDSPISVARLEKQNEWAIGGRLGAVVASRTMVYGLAGYQQTTYDFSGIEHISNNDGSGKSFSKETDFDGIVLGGGVEFALAANIFLGLEYQHFFGGEEQIFDIYNKTANVGGRIDDDLDEDKVQATLKIKFGREDLRLD